MQFFKKDGEWIPVINLVREWAKSVSFPGFQKVPVYDVVVFFIKEIVRDDITTRASSIAFNYFIAIFPATIFLFTLLPYIPIDNLQFYMNEMLKNLLPEDVYGLMYVTINDIILQPRGGLLSIGFFLALFFATNGVLAIMTSFDKALDNFRKRTYLHTRWIALKITFFLSILLVATLILIIAGNWMLEEFLLYADIRSEGALLLANLVRWFFIVLLLFNAISLIYYFGPATHNRWRFISTGSTLATILTLLFSIGFSYYVNNFGQYNKFYGSLGTIIAFMLWMYFNSLALLIGFELNASIDYHKHRIREVEEMEERIFSS